MTGATTAFSQNVEAPPHNVLQLSASATVEVRQDLLTITLGTARDGADAGAVQTRLKAAVDAALTEARRDAQPGLLEVRTGNFSLGPRYTRDGKIDGWRGSAEIVIEGRDLARIAQTAGRIDALSVSSVGYGLSREERGKAESRCAKRCHRELQAEGDGAGTRLRLRRLHPA